MVRKYFELVMRKYIIYLFLTVTWLISCNKHTDVSTTPEDAYISFRLDLPSQTKSLINPDAQTSNFDTEGSRIMMYDVFTPVEDGVAMQDAERLIQYLDQQSLRCNGVDWVFTKTPESEEEIKIPWTKSGIHDFFAYNSYDAASNKAIPFEVGYDSFEDDPISYTTGKHQYFRVPASGDLTLTETTNQFDFIYSSEHRDVDVDGHKQVEMNFKHLYAAVYFEIKNISNSPMRLNSFSLGGIKNKGNARIDYNGNVALNLSSTYDSPFAKTNLNKELSTGSSHVIFEQNGTAKAILIWPHSATDFAGASFSINYNLGKNSKGNWNSATPKQVKLSGADSPYKVNNWAAGSLYKYNVTVSDNKISLAVTRVVDWINDDVILEE